MKIWIKNRNNLCGNFEKLLSNDKKKIVELKHIKQETNGNLLIKSR